MGIQGQELVFDVEDESGHHHYERDLSHALAAVLEYGGPALEVDLAEQLAANGGVR